MSALDLEIIHTKLNAVTGWALVVGDLMLDRYYMGDVQRISPEAPVPVVLLKIKQDRAGGAANVAANLAGLGIHTKILGCVGDDAEGKVLIGLMQGLGLDTQGVFSSSHRPTIAKTRILGGHQQMLRLDQEDASTFTTQENQTLNQQLQRLLAQKPEVVILSDYAKGLLSAEVCQHIIQVCIASNTPVLVDPKGKDYSKYKGATGLTPNKKETAEACGVDMRLSETLLAAAAQLKQALNLNFLAVTRGEEGITLIQDNQNSHIAATAKQVFDVSGAGDTVIATLAAGLMAKLNVEQALSLANIAAGIVVGKVGTVPIQKEELLLELQTQKRVVQADKICNLDNLLTRVAVWKNNHEKIVFTNGCFDLLHAGHVTYLEAAKHAGDRLILGLNTDRSVSALKGPNRPVIHEMDRARVLAALEAVDAVILFDEDTPLNLINAIEPEVLAKGSDYTEDQVVGAKEVKAWGGKVALIDLVQGRSTSNIVKKLAS